MKRELGIARCGLACCLCSENVKCNGCGSSECPDNDGKIGVLGVENMWIAVDRLTNWECVKEFSVGGLEWIGFSKEYYNKLLCISSQKCTLVDCKTGIIDECDCEYDELTHTALCSLLPNEMINISGQYGGKFHVLLRKMIKLELKSSQIIRQRSILQMIHN